MRTLIASSAILLTTSVAAMACPDFAQLGATHTLTGEELYSPQDYTVIAGGNQSLSACGFDYIGHTISSPDFSFNLSGTEAYSRVEVEVTSADCDTVLLVNSAKGEWFFDDDSNEGQPTVNLTGVANTEGRVDVWVGTYGTDTCEATLQMETW